MLRRTCTHVWQVLHACRRSPGQAKPSRRRIADSECDEKEKISPAAQTTINQWGGADREGLVARLIREDPWGEPRSGGICVSRGREPAVSGRKDGEPRSGDTVKTAQVPSGQSWEFPNSGAAAARLGFTIWTFTAGSRPRLIQMSPCRANSRCPRLADAAGSLFGFQAQTSEKPTSEPLQPNRDP